MKRLKLVMISDTHEYFIDPEDMPEGDVLIHAGDMTFHGTQNAVQLFNNWCGEVKHKYRHGIVGIPGNHDKSFDPLNKSGKPEIVVPMMTNITLLNDSGLDIDGFKLWGSPWTPEFGRGWAFNANQIEILGHWDLIPDDTDVLITHGPPYKILDGVPDRYWSPLSAQPRIIRNVGCHGLLNALDRVKPLVHCFGHIHEGHGTHQENGTWFINASIMDEAYQARNQPIVLTIKK